MLHYSIAWETNEGVNQVCGFQLNKGIDILNNLKPETCEFLTEMTYNKRNHYDYNCFKEIADKIGYDVVLKAIDDVRQHGNFMERFMYKKLKRQMRINKVLSYIV